jgi:hydroxymethylpyrimidine/phosphomethylpyrimidine kinase
MAANQHGASYTLVTGITTTEGWIENTLASAQTALLSEKFPHLDAVFSGAGDTLSAALAALLASNCEIESGFSEALSYLDRCLAGGFRPGMGHQVPDRLFWAQPDAGGEEAGGTSEAPDPMPPNFLTSQENKLHDTHH